MAYYLGVTVTLTSELIFRLIMLGAFFSLLFELGIVNLVCGCIQLLIKLKYRQIKKCLDLSLSDVVFTMLINVGILTFMSRINFVLR